MFFIEGNPCPDLGSGDTKTCRDDPVTIISCEVVIHDFKALLFFTWMIRDSLCELHIKQESYELAAFLACKLKE
ncbi:Hok/Gef family protein [Escherichia coli]|nr:Hok/Gef family protein [Escherichia coli]HBC0994295.1 Hok/Gef family protein [Escherichia coli]